MFVRFIEGKRRELSGLSDIVNLRLTDAATEEITSTETNISRFTLVICVMIGVSLVVIWVVLFRLKQDHKKKFQYVRPEIQA